MAANAHAGVGASEANKSGAISSAGQGSRPGSGLAARQFVSQAAKAAEAGEREDMDKAG